MAEKKKTEETEWSMLVNENSVIVGKKIKNIEDEYGVKISELDNFNDRLLSFFAKKPPHNRIVKESDSIAVVGEFKKCRKFSKVVW
ncbi:TrkA C-terminal domain-containing protein [Patescibacteria group bacterium]|nr:TrkA C-terminal domain-containing protein [Patescibacteria group bacterium]